MVGNFSLLLGGLGLVVQDPNHETQKENMILWEGNTDTVELEEEMGHPSENSSR